MCVCVCARARARACERVLAKYMANEHGCQNQDLNSRIV